MIKKQINIHIVQLADISELSEIEQKLVHEAGKITANAYAPYSGFQVGAAVLLENGEIITGSNQENAAYPSGICAERTAVYYANSRFPETAILAIAITASTKGRLISKPAYPCGACRQVLLEARNRSGKAMKVILAGDDLIEVVDDARDLLPLPFETID